MRVLLIIPAHNESKSIVRVVSEIEQQGYDYIVINDGSTDDTLEICQQNRINVINLSENLGIGGAVQAGHLFAFRNGYDIDIQVDGDGQHDISYVPILIAGVMNGADLVVGSRFLDDSHGFKSSFMRRVGIKWLSNLIYLLFRVRATDPTSGFRASGKRAIELFCENYPSDYPEPESIAEVLRHNFQIVEVPVTMNERTEGKSSIGILDSVYYMVKVTLAILIQASTRLTVKKDS